MGKRDHKKIIRPGGNIKNDTKQTEAKEFDVKRYLGYSIFSIHQKGKDLEDMENQRIPIEGRLVVIGFIEQRFIYLPWRERKGIYRGLRAKRRIERREIAAIKLLGLAIGRDKELTVFASRALAMEVSSWQLPTAPDRLAQYVQAIADDFRTRLRFRRGKFSFLPA